MDATNTDHAGSQALNADLTDGPLPPLPAPPTPCADPGMIPAAASPAKDLKSLPDTADIDIFTLSPESTMKMLCNTIETLVLITGDVPPTPPVSHPSTPIPRVLPVEEENGPRNSGDTERRRSRQATQGLEDVDSVPCRAKTPIGSPESGPFEPLLVIGAHAEPLHIQHGVISRKFYSKKPPPIALEEYLSRLHRYCPMSPAVYLATSYYIHRLAVVQKIISVTPRNAHRLLLAALRIAMKALEDLSYPHKRFSKVGGVTEQELAKLEVSFCFLTNFDLKVDEEMLLKHAKTIGQGIFLHAPPKGFQPRLPLSKVNGHLGQTLPGKDLTEAPAAA